MSIDSITSSYQTIQQLGQIQRKEPPSATDLTSKILEVSDGDSNGLISATEVSISDELFAFFDSDGDGSLNSTELEEGISLKLENIKNQNLTPQKFGEFLAELGLQVPSSPNQNEGMPPPPPPSSVQMASDIFSSNTI